MASAKRVTKPCEDCGTLLVDVVTTRKLCYDCSKKRNRIYQREYQKKAKAKKKTKPETPIINHNAKYCKGCKYWYGAYDCYCMCNYIFDVGHKRPCPPGKDCTEKVIVKRGRKIDCV